MPEKPLSLSEIRDRCARFGAEWSGESRERGESQSFWTELLDAFGVSRRRQGVLFERPSRRASTGNTGFIDVFWPGLFLAEQKSGGALRHTADGEWSNAEDQAFDYLNGGDITDAEMPRYVMTSDFTKLQVTDLEAPLGDPSRTVTFAVEDLADNYEKLLFLAGYQRRSFVEQDHADASIEAARLMADLYVTLTGDADVDYTDPEAEEAEEAAMQDVSVLMTRLLFLLFGDDAGLWPSGAFQRFLQERTSEDGADLGAQLNAVFDWLDTPDSRRPARADLHLRDLPYVNGEVFTGHVPTMYFDRQMRDALLAACEFDWRRISPAVFGSLFQAIKSKEARRADGEHYTTEENILKLLRPLFLDELREALQKADTVTKLRNLHKRLADLRYLDPACGCGNFLVVAYREMRQLELDLLVKLRQLEGTELILALDAKSTLNVRLDQFNGIEINWWPARIAETALFLTDFQANRRMEKTLGLVPQQLPIDIGAKIVHADALTTDWRTILPPTPTTHVFGNPPFLGDHTRTEDQKALLQSAWGGDKTLGRLDFVTAWHAKTLDYLRDANGEWAFVTTNSITQGDQAPRLFGEIRGQGWRIKFAHRTFAWTSEAPGAAAVHCIIVGFTKRSARPRLFSYPTLKGDPVEMTVGFINAYLVDGPDVLVPGRTGTPLAPDLVEVRKGSMATDGGNFVITPDTYDEVTTDPLAAKYLRPYIGSRELLSGQKRWCLWLVDADPADLRNSPELRRRVQGVKDFRSHSSAATTRSYPHHHLFRQFGEKQTGRFIGLPEVSSENRRWLPVAYFDQDVIVSNKIYAAPDDGGLIFGIASSDMFWTWMKLVGGRMKSDPSFSNSMTWNNFPLPKLDDTTKQRIIAAGQAILTARAGHPDRPLDVQYDPLVMEPDLVKAHRALDRVVEKLFGVSAGATELDKQRLLLNSYAEMTAGLAPSPRRSKRG